MPCSVEDGPGSGGVGGWTEAGGGAPGHLTFLILEVFLATTDTPCFWSRSLLPRLSDEDAEGLAQQESSGAMSAAPGTQAFPPSCSPGVSIRPDGAPARNSCPRPQAGIPKCAEPEAVPVCAPTVLGSRDHPPPPWLSCSLGSRGAHPVSISLHPGAPLPSQLLFLACLGLPLSATQGFTLFPSGGRSTALVTLPTRAWARPHCPKTASAEGRVTLSP